MPKTPTLKDLREALRQLPVDQRRAILRRASIRSVSGNDLTKSPQVPENTEEILCQPLQVCDNAQQKAKNGQLRKTIDITGSFARHRKCEVLAPVAKAPINLVSNAPEYSGGMPDDLDNVQIFALKRELKHTEEKLRQAQTKLTRAIEELQSQRRFFRLGLLEKHWETYDQLHRRLGKIESTLQFLDDPLVALDVESEIPDRWKKKGTTDE